MQYGLLGAVSGGGNYTIPINVNPAYSSFVSGVAKYGAPVLGAAIDFGMQIGKGEKTIDAGIKTGAHVAIGIGSAKAGATLGTAIGGPVGTVVGGVVGFVGGVAGSMLFDWVYDNKENITNFVGDTLHTAGKLFDKEISRKIDGIGEALSGAAHGLGSIFG